MSQRFSLYGSEIPCLAVTCRHLRIVSYPFGCMLSAHSCDLVPQLSPEVNSKPFTSIRLNYMLVLAGAQAYAADLTNSFAGNSTAFAAATARFSVVRQCLFNATIAADASASASATAAATAIAQSDANAASEAITGAICNPVTATATAQAFAQAIAQAQGCNGVIYQAISSKYICCAIFASTV